VAVFEENAAKKLRENLADTNIKVLAGQLGLCAAACAAGAAKVFNSMAGIEALVPTLEAINQKKDIAIANKEILVCAGSLLMAAAKQKNVNILPVDSEHSAIFQCLEGCKDKKFVKKLILTASGGPFWGKKTENLKNITVKDAIAHPNWKMGKKISVDSASLMNKGLELIEAVHLFGLSQDKIDVIIHRESVIHSMVEFEDNSVVAQISAPDMRLPIQYALTWPERDASLTREMDFAEVGNLSFAKPDEDSFVLVDLCRKAAQIGGTAPAFVCAADEEAVNLFLNEKISFLQMIDLIKRAFEYYSYKELTCVEDVFAECKRARETVEKKK
jgi:1-deoxy-D-xylulose-5-phosphate reductoisomerase